MEMSKRIPEVAEIVSEVFTLNCVPWRSLVNTFPIGFSVCSVCNCSKTRENLIPHKLLFDVFFTPHASLKTDYILWFFQLSAFEVFATLPVYTTTEHDNGYQLVSIRKLPVNFLAIDAPEPIIVHVHWPEGEGLPEIWVACRPHQATRVRVGVNSHVEVRMGRWSEDNL